MDGVIGAVVILVLSIIGGVLIGLFAASQIPEDLVRFKEKCYAYEGKTFEDECIVDGKVVFTRSDFKE